jgi:hypothetical protein
MRFAGTRAIVVVAVMTFVLVGQEVIVVGQQVDARDAQATQLLDVDMSAIGAWDSDRSAASVVPGFGRTYAEGYSTWGIGRLQYTRRFIRMGFQASAASAVRYSPAVRQFESAVHIGSVGVFSSLPSRFELRLDETVAYSPAHLYAVFPTLPVGADERIQVSPDQDYDIEAPSSYRSNTNLTLTRHMSRRTNISVGADYNLTRFSDVDPTRPTLFTPIDADTFSYSIRSRLSHNVTPSGAVSAEYRYRGGNFGYNRNATTTQHSLTIGYEVERRLSRSRILELFARVGGSFVEVPEELAEFDIGPQQYRANAEVGIRYPMTRTGELRGSYTRSLQFIAGLTHPVFVDGFSGEFNTGLGRGFAFLARASKATGQSAYTSDRLLDTYSGQLRLDYELNRRLSLYAQYIQYFYDTRGEVDTLPGIPIAPGIPADMDRRGVRVGVELRMPVLRR